MEEKNKNAQKSKGFSLVELMVVMIISFIVIWGAIDFFNEQQKVFRQQSLQAKNQGGMRMALYYITKDLTNAGFTGGPFGIETAILDAQQRVLVDFPVVAAKTADLTLESDMPTLTNESGAVVDALEIWANFSGKSSRLSAVANPGVGTLYAFTVDSFVTSTQNCVLSTGVCTTVAAAFPMGVIITNYTGSGEYVAASSVSLSDKSISTDPIVKYYRIRDPVAPVWRRIYYIREIPANGPRWLIRRDFYGNNLAIDRKIAEGITDMQITYDLAPAANQITLGVDPAVTAVDPSYIQAVSVTMTAINHDIDSVIPIKIMMNRKIKLENLGLHPKLNALRGW